MENDSRDKPSRSDRAYVDRVVARALLRENTKNAGEAGVWFGLGAMGIIGWSVTVPTLLGTALGWWLDGHHPGGHGWTLALLFAGLTLGCLNAWVWVSKQGAGTNAPPREHR